MTVPSIGANTGVPVDAAISMPLCGLRDSPLKIRRKIGADTVFHNRMAHLGRDIPVVLVENNEHVATMGIEPATVYRVGPDNVIRTAGGATPAILHQYDRIPEIKAPVEARWR